MYVYACTCRHAYNINTYTTVLPLCAFVADTQKISKDASIASASFAEFVVVLLISWRSS